MQPSPWKVLSPAAHGILDYAVVAGFALAPSLFGFSPTPTTLAYILAAIHFVVTLATAFPLGAFKLIPFPVHGALEFVVALVLVTLPWLAGFAAEPAARNFYVVAGAAIVLVVMFTNYQAESTPRTAPPVPAAR